MSTRRRARLTDPDVVLLRFAAEHRFILGVHVASLLETTPTAAGRRLQRLAAAGHLRAERRLAGPSSYQITRRGLGTVASTLRPPREIDLGVYDHDVGLAWVWLAAQHGAFGPLAGLRSERDMRSHDARAEPGQDPLGVRLLGAGPRGGVRRHYPDLLLLNASGQRVAVELELTAKGARRQRQIMAGYSADGRIDAVLYLVETQGMRRSVEHAAAAEGVSGLIEVRSVRFLATSGAIGSRRGRASPVRDPDLSLSRRRTATAVVVSR